VLLSILSTAGGNSHSHVSVRTEQTGLLQCYTSWFAKIYDCTTSTCSERCSQTDRICRSLWPRYKYAATITLASGAIRITYKLCLLMHLIHTSQAPSYLTDIVTQTASVTSQTWLRSGSSLRYEQPRTRLKFGQGAFSYAAPAVWNSLPPSLQELLVSDTASFKRNLKTSLFQQAFYRWVVFTFCTLPLGFILVFRCAVHHWSLL